MRIDKWLANKGRGSRKEVHRLLKQGVVTVNNVVVTAKETAIDPEKDCVAVNGEPVSSQTIYYVKLHKPAGYITAVKDSRPTVMDILPQEYASMGVVPVGRLDKDTEGLLLLTNDGQWGHKVINGRKSVPKVYAFTYEGILSEEGLHRIRTGITLGDGTICKPAEITLLDDNRGRITVEEGKYHQVKRMIGAAGGTITYLKRLSVGTITLSGIEEVGQYDFLTEEEISQFNINL